MEIASIVASFVSLIIGILAGWLSIHFYNKTKEDASRVDIALAEIREQTNALQSISAGFLDRLTKYVTTPQRQQPPPDTSRLVLETLRGIPEVVQMLRITEVSTTKGIDPKDWAIMLVALQNYTAETNFWASTMLPTVDRFDSKDTFHSLIRGVIDRSIADFRHVSGLLEGVDLTHIRGTTVEGLHRDTHQNLVNMIGDTAFHFHRKAQWSKDHENEEG